MRGQSIAAANQARFLIGKENYLRINPIIPDGILTMDGTDRADEMIGKAAHHSRKEMPTIAQLISEHKASAFTPVHKL